MIFIGDERRIVTDQAREEAYQLHLMDPKPTWQHPQLNQQDPSEGRRPLVEHDLLVHLGRALKRETKAKGFEQYSGNSAKQMKTSLNFWKGFIIPTDIILMQTLRPLKISEWQM